jgi:hypothetical protein
MITKFFKFLSISFIFFTLTGCIQATALLGPGLTVATTGNIFQAGFQYGANKVIKKDTGKDSYEHLRDFVKKKNEDLKKTDKIK